MHTLPGMAKTSSIPAEHLQSLIQSLDILIQLRQDLMSLANLCDKTSNPGASTICTKSALCRMAREDVAHVKNEAWICRRQQQSVQPGTREVASLTGWKAVLSFRPQHSAPERAYALGATPCLLKLGRRCDSAGVYLLSGSNAVSAVWAAGTALREIGLEFPRGGCSGSYFCVPPEAAPWTAPNTLRVYSSTVAARSAYVRCTGPWAGRLCAEKSKWSARQGTPLGTAVSLHWNARLAFQEFTYKCWI